MLQNNKNIIQWQNMSVIRWFHNTLKITKTWYIEYLLSEVLEPGVILEHLHMATEKLWEGDPSLNIKFTYISHILCIHSLKVILCSIFNAPVFWLQLVTWC